MNQKKLNLQNTVSSLLGSDWQKIKNVKTAYSLFTPFKNKKTEQVFYFYIFYASTQFHLSEETVNYALNKYSPYLSQVEFLLIERGFNFNSYLIKSDHYLIDLNQMIRLKKQCCEPIQKELIIKTIQFLIKFYKTKNFKQFSQISPFQIGVTENGDLILCDYSLYFKKKGQQLKTLSQNICNCIIPMLETASPKSSQNVPSLIYNLQETLLSNYNQNFLKLIKTLVLDPINKMENQGFFNGFSKEITLEQIQNSLSIYKETQINDGNTTLDHTFQEQEYSNEASLKKSQSKNFHSYLINQSIKEPFLPKNPAQNKKNYKIIIFVTFLALLLLIGIFSFVFLHYFKDPIVCQVGQFKKENANVCLPCAQGCLRCSSDQNQSCYNCVQTMYLVLNDENDKTGDCMKNCVGRVLHSNFCVKNKKIDHIKQEQNPNLSY